MKILFTLTFSLCFLLTGCDTKPSNEIGFGEIVDGVYTNDYFKIEVKVPEDWVVQSQASQRELMDVGTNLLAGENKNLKAVLKESQKQTISLFTFFKHEVGSPVVFNPSFIAVAERVSAAPGVKRGSDYLFHVKNLSESGQFNVEFPKKIYTESISGVSFDVMLMETIITSDNIVSQNYYSAIIDEYALSFILSYTSESEIKELKEMLSDVQFLK